MPCMQLLCYLSTSIRFQESNSYKACYIGALLRGDPEVSVHRLVLEYA